MLKIEILDNSYETGYPTVGQCIDIKRLEMTLSGNKMNLLINSNSLEDSEVALDIKAISIISILFPKLKKDLKCESLLDLEYSDWMEILNVFSRDIFPWYMDWKKSLRKLNTDLNLDEHSDTGTEG